MMTRLVYVCSAIAILGAASIAAAQAPPVVNRLELQRLVAGDAPADHLRLSRHFAALAASYEADATRYAAIAPGLAGNPNRSGFTEPGAKWRRLAERAREEMGITFALAVHHARVAEGVASIAVEGAGRYYGGEGAPEPTAADVRAFAASARTRADYTLLVEHYVTIAGRAERKADTHAARATALRATPTRTGDPAAHCDLVIRAARKEAERARNRAFTYRQLADISG
jgi:hypothetical protein